MAQYLDTVGFASSAPAPSAPGSTSSGRNSWGLFEHPAWTAAKNLLSRAGGNDAPEAPKGAGEYLNLPTILFGVIGGALVLIGLYLFVAKGKDLIPSRMGA